MNVNVAQDRMAKDLVAQDRIAHDLSTAKSLDDYYAKLVPAHMGAGWNKSEPSLYPTPKKTFLPAHWPYRTARVALDAAARLVGTQDAERRNLTLHNPLPGNTYGTAPTIVAAYQMIKGFEAARSHRHTPNAMRFILESGARTYTIVDGKKVPMEEGDVLLTPNWCWHGHVNEGPQNAYWVDFLDVPLTHLLGPVFFQRLDESFVESAAEVAPDSPFRFPFAAWAAKAKAQAETRTGLREVVLGPPFLDSLRIKWRHLAANATFEEPQTTANCVYAVHSGTGTVTCDDHQFEWARGDVFVIPAWHSARWQAGSESYLLRVSDENLLEKLNWLHTAEPGGRMEDAGKRTGAF
jgi:gentisate 1,2-dioxygenase